MADNLWYTPCYALKEIHEIMGKNNIGFNDRRFQKCRELWIASIAIIGYSKISGKNFWLQVPSEDPPDVLATRWEDNGKGGEIQIVQQVEIFEITQYDKHGIDEIIINKLKNKAYPKDYVLIGYIRRDEGINPTMIYRKIKLINPNIGGILLLGGSMENTKRLILTQIFPEPTPHFDFEVEEECKHSNQLGPVIRIKRGTKKETTSTIIENPPFVCPIASYFKR